MSLRGSPAAAAPVRSTTFNSSTLRGAESTRLTNLLHGNHDDGKWKIRILGDAQLLREQLGPYVSPRTLPFYPHLLATRLGAFCEALDDVAAGQPGLRWTEVQVWEMRLVKIASRRERATRAGGPFQGWWQQYQVELEPHGSLALHARLPGQGLETMTVWLRYFDQISHLGDTCVRRSRRLGGNGAWYLHPVSTSRAHIPKNPSLKIVELSPTMPLGATAAFHCLGTMHDESTWRWFWGADPSGASAKDFEIGGFPGDMVIGTSSARVVLRNAGRSVHQPEKREEGDVGGGRRVFRKGWRRMRGQ
ncbi:hypothetical protein JCM6882_009353 [Rhodosporidiobolus microsporus]